MRRAKEEAYNMGTRYYFWLRNNDTWLQSGRANGYETQAEALHDNRREIEHATDWSVLVTSVSITKRGGV